MVQAMDAGLHEIRLETYILDVHGGAEQVMQALERAALRGVSVALVVDGVGTPALPAPWPQRLTAAGVQWRVFAPWGAWACCCPVVGGVCIASCVWWMVK